MNKIFPSELTDAFTRAENEDIEKAATLTPEKLAFNKAKREDDLHK